MGEIAAFDVSAAEMYKYERAGTNSWSGKIALMYPSDYGYSADLSSCQTTLNAYNHSNCKTTNWLYDSTKSQWTPIPFSSRTDHAIDVNLNGYVRNNGVLGVYGVRPVLYLNSDVGIVEEKETSEGLKYFVVE